MRLLLAVVLAFALAGCGTTVAEPTPAPAPSLPLPAASPVTLSFPAVGIDGAPLSPTGLDDKGALEVPPLTDPGRVVWLRWSARMAPGRATVLAAHVSGRNADGQAVAGAFFRLGEAIPGDEVTVRDATGHLTVYTVRDVQVVPKTAFPTDRAYAPRPRRWLVLATCGGDLDPATRSYRDNVLVFAEATS